MQLKSGRIFRYSFLLIFSFISFKGLPQSPHWLWGKSTNGAYSYCSATAAETDSLGNIYIAGNFEGPYLLLDSITLTNTNISGSDVFIVKLDPSGNVIWAKSAGGTYDDHIHSMTIDSTGNIFIAGSYNYSDISFGSISLPYTPGAGLFLVKYDALGNPVWAKTANSIDSYATSVKIGSDGDIFLAGNYSTMQLTFGTTTINNTYGYNTYDCFIAKFDQGGNAIWVKSVGGTRDEHQIYMELNSSDDVFLAAAFNSLSWDIDGHPINLTSGPYMETDIFIAKFNADGQTQWAKSINGHGDDIVTSMDIDLSGNLLLAGYFKSNTLYFNTDSINNADSTAEDIFLAKYNENGSVLWVKGAGGTEEDIALGITTDLSENIYLTGGCYSTNVEFDALTQISWPFYLVKYDPAGNAVWVESSDVGDAFGNCVTTDRFGNIIACGSYSTDTIAFDSVHIVGSMSDFDCFIVKAGSAPANISFTDALCFGGNTGSATAVPGGGSPPYSYLWSTVPPQTTQTASGLAAGSYSVTVSDSDNYFTIGYVTISQPAPIITEYDQTICQGDTFIFGTEICTEDGLYIDTLTSVSGCDSILKVNLSVDTLPQAPLLPTVEPRICLDSPMSYFTTSISDSSTFFWNLIPAEAGNINNLNSLTCSVFWNNAWSDSVYIFVSSQNGCGITNSDTLKLIRIDCNCDVYVPNVFSPNNDGENDVLFLRSNCIEKLDFFIFDRWGHKVFESHDINVGWNGEINNHMADPGVYMYFFKAWSDDGTMHSSEGNVTLFR